MGGRSAREVWEDGLWGDAMEGPPTPGWGLDGAGTMYVAKGRT